MLSGVAISDIRGGWLVNDTNAVGRQNNGIQALITNLVQGKSFM
jgi:hypothetical protein